MPDVLRAGPGAHPGASPVGEVASTLCGHHRGVFAGLPAPLFRYGLTQRSEVGRRRSAGWVVAQELTVDHDVVTHNVSNLGKTASLLRVADGVTVNSSTRDDRDRIQRYAIAVGVRIARAGRAL